MVTKGLILSIFITITFIGCSMNVTYSGYVVDKTNQNGIEGVEVILYGVDENKKLTDSNGYFEISGNMNTDYVNNSWISMSFIKNGYFRGFLNCGDDGAESDQCADCNDHNDLIIEMIPE